LGWLLILTGVMAFFSVPKHSPALAFHTPALPLQQEKAANPVSADAPGL
jgi:hypothetical protein